VAADSEPPYLRIVADIRRRIADGELAPGAPVPSTRRISREWGVALATATKALTTLRMEGLVETRPRVGTVVAGRPAPGSPGPRTPRTTRATVPSSSPDHELSRERIVRTAIEIADAEGLSALSMRGVAARLGVAAMSPYRYVDGKDDLVLLMADAAFGEADYPATPPDDWRARLELGARTLWRLYRRHPWLAQLGPLTRPLMLPNLMVHAEWMLGALDGWELPVWALLAWIIVAGTVVPFFAALLALRHLPATMVTMVAMLEPVGAATLGWAWFDETLSPPQLAGAVAVVAGILLAQSARRVARQPVEPPVAIT